MALNNHHSTQSGDLKNLDFTLWRLRREHDLRHQQDVNRILSESQHARH